MFLGPFLNYEAQRATSNSMETSTEGTDPWSISARPKVDSPDLEVHPRPVWAEPQVPAPVSSLHFQICCGEWGVMLQTWEQLKIDIFWYHHIFEAFGRCQNHPKARKPGTWIWAQKLTEWHRYRRKWNKKQNLFKMRIFVKFLVSGRVANWGQGWSLTNVIL